MRRHYLLAGVAVALALAAVIVAVGLRSGGASGVAGATDAASPPTGHPTVAGKGGAGTPEPSTGAPIEKTIAKLEVASAQDPKDVATLLKLGDAYFLGQDYKRAARAYNDVLGLDSGNVAATVRLAMVWHADGDTARAEGCSSTRISCLTTPAWRSITVTEPSLGIWRTGSTRTVVPLPAGAVRSLVPGRRPPRLLT